MSNEYTVISRGVNNRKMFSIDENLQEHADTDRNHDWYKSIFIYNEEHYKRFQETNSVAGIKDVTTNILLWDFDSKNDVELARQDSLTLVSRLINDHGISNPEIHFSGNKGFHVSVTTDKRYTPQEFKSITYNVAGDLTTYDPSVSDANRLIRLEYTKHQHSGLFKVPLTRDQLFCLTLDEIKARASTIPNDLSNEKHIVNLPNSLYILKDRFEKKELKKDVVPMDVSELDFTRKMKGLTNCKFAISEGYYEDGERSVALMAYAATLKGNHVKKKIAYRMLKGAEEYRVDRQGGEVFPKHEIWNNIVSQVYSDTWQGGHYSCKNNLVLKGICDRLGKHSCANTNAEETDVPQPIVMGDIVNPFKDYVKNIDKNTVLTGIKSIDDNVFISTGSNVGIIGAPASGKSALALNILNNTSRAGVKSVFASLDMSSNRMLEKVLYKISGLPREELYRTFQEDKEGPLVDKLKEEFGNCNFFSKSSPNVNDIRDYISRCEDESGEKVRLVMLDYFERVTSDVGDDTMASKKVAGQLQDLVNDMNLALITLVQPNKMALGGGSASTPIYDYSKIKGSSFVYQAFRQIISIWRPFYHPKEFKDDHFMKMAVLKNDLGELNEFTFGWNGKRGLITELTDEEFMDFETRMKNKDDKEIKAKMGGVWD